MAFAEAGIHENRCYWPLSIVCARRAAAGKFHWNNRAFRVFWLVKGMTEADHREADFRQAALACLDGLYGYAMSLSHNQADAEDLVQETYLRAVRAFGQLAPDSNLKNWLYAILRNVWLNQVRHTQSGPQFVDMSNEQQEEAIGRACSSDNPYATYVAAVERDSVRAAVEQLTVSYREVIVLREFEGLSYNEIAEILQCPAGTVMSRLGRAREKLRILLSVWNARPRLEARQHGAL
jgi:RNA polymerase sigma-70 factor, ECF subfamily